MTEVASAINHDQAMLMMGGGASNKQQHVSGLDSSGISSSVSQFSYETNLTAPSDTTINDSDESTLTSTRSGRSNSSTHHPQQHQKVPSIKDTWKYTIANSMSFLKNQRSRGPRADLIISNFLSESNRLSERSNSIDITAFALKFSDPHLKDIDNIEKNSSNNASFQTDRLAKVPHVASFGQTANKSSWDILCKIINCKVAFKKQNNGRKYNWIQLAGHAGSFFLHSM